MDYNNHTQVIETIPVSANLNLFISVSLDNSVIFLDIDYMKGKYTIQKNFTNNYLGLEQLEETKKQFSSEEFIVNYLNLKTNK